MLRIGSGLCHLPEIARNHGTHGIHGRRVCFLCSVYSVCSVVCFVVGCSAQQSSLAEQATVQKEKGTQIVSFSSLSSDAATSTAPSARPPSDATTANVSRLQKPESDPPPSMPKQSQAARSILDLASYQAPTNGETAAHIRATVNGEAILDEEVREAVYPYLLATQNLSEPERTARRKEAFNKQLDQLVERELILQDMFAHLKDREQILKKLKEQATKDFDKKMREKRKAMNIKTDEEMKAFLRAQGLSIEGIRRQIERTFMAMEWMRNRIIPYIDRIGPEQLRTYYDGHPEEFQVSDSVTWQDIFIDAGRYSSREQARHFALQLMARARAGEDFRKLVTQYDQGNSSYLNGEGYGHRRGEIKPPAAEALLFKMRDGDMDMVELTNGFHVIRLMHRQFAGLKPFDEKTQTAIREKLSDEIWKREYQQVLKELKRKASIEISRNP